MTLEREILFSIILAAAAASLTYLLAPLTAKLSSITGALDIPDGKRKINTKKMPRLGGLSFLFSFFLCITLFLLHERINPVSPDAASLFALLAGGSILAAGGVSDDVAGLNPIFKLLLQLAAAVVALAFLPLPDEFSVFGIIRIPLTGVIAYLFMLFRLVFTVNAVNFSDGLDGLASGLSLVALFSLFIFGMANGKPIAASAALILGASVAGFIPYNRYHAKIYMGDVGSQFLGLAIAILALASTKDGRFTFETSLFLFIPMLDTTLSVTRRILRGKSPFKADKGHLHHLLLKRGRSHPRAVKLLVGISALVALVTLAFSLP